MTVDYPVICRDSTYRRISGLSQALRYCLGVLSFACFAGTQPQMLSAQEQTLPVHESAISSRPLASTALSFSIDALEQVSIGDHFSFSLPSIDDFGIQHEIPVTAEIEDDDHYINGDRVLFAHGVADGVSDSLRLVLTAGKGAVFADIHLDDRRWVFEATRQGREITGILYQPGSPVNQQQPDAPHTSTPDFVIPDVQAPGRLSTAAPFAQELVLGTRRENETTATVLASSNLQISQSFSLPAIYIGETSELEVTLQFKNTGGQSLSRLSAEVYFILEDAELINAPACIRVMTNTSPRQPILRCELPGALAAGATRTLSYQVRVPAKSAPMRLWSTVFVGAQRHDANLNVVNNIDAGMRSNGVSDYNQILLPELISDRLGNVVIDVMALYTPDAEAMYGAATATRINQLISVANQIYQDSGVGITLRPVHHGRVNYPGTGVDMHRQLDELTSGNHPALGQVSALRQRYGADLVVLFRPMDAQSDLCGLANLGGYRTMGDMMAFNERDYAYSLVAIDCPVSSALVHELGHNMGLTHSHREDGSGGTFSFATGYGVDGSFTTVMATPRRFGDAGRVARFSDPQASCHGIPCGVDHNDPVHGADAVRALNLVRFQIAAYMPTRVPVLPARQAGRLSGGESSARIAIAASTDKGLSYAQSVSPAQRMDITADFYVETAHVGKQGQFHVLADLSAAGLGVVQLNERGEIFGWDGSVADLVPYSAPQALKPVEYLRILNDFQPIPAMHGFPLVLFVAYQLPGSSEIIYTVDPLTVNIAR